MELGATTCTARCPRCTACPLRHGCRAAARGAPPPARPRRSRAARPQPRFEDTDRWLRGRVVAALVRGEPLPDAEPGRCERVLAGLERDGLIRRVDGGAVSLPDER